MKFLVELEAKFPEIEGEPFDDFIQGVLKGKGEIKIVMPLGPLGSYTFVPTTIKKIKKGKLK